MDGVRARIPVAADASDHEPIRALWGSRSFQQLPEAGISRISIWVQSFGDDKLIPPRAYSMPEKPRQGCFAARGGLLGLRSFNLDLMHGLPGSISAEALSDLRGR